MMNGQHVSHTDVVAAPLEKTTWKEYLSLLGIVFLFGVILIPIAHLTVALTPMRSGSYFTAVNTAYMAKAMIGFVTLIFLFRFCMVIVGLGTIYALVVSLGAVILGEKCLRKMMEE